MPSTDYTTFAAYVVDAQSATWTQDLELRIRWVSSASEIVENFVLQSYTATDFRFTLTAYPGEGFRDHASKLTNALRYNASNGACTHGTIRHDGSANKFYTVKNIQNKITDATSGLSVGRGFKFYETAGLVVSNVIVQNTVAGTAAGLWLLDAKGTALIENVSIEISTGNGLGLEGTNPSALQCRNMTVLMTGTAASGHTGFAGGTGSNQTAYNCASFGFFTDSDTTWSGGSHNATDKATGGFPATNRQNSLTPSSELTNVTAGSVDMRLLTGATSKNNGTASFGPSTDIVGQSRSGSTDIGVWEFQDASASVNENNYQIITRGVNRGLIRGSTNG